ncbi:MAG: hypothetical protein K2Z81_21505 [Cyanobacteria bacterium]|nr:hypothetical protein [Cyanobacteriota bacterium]
MFRNLFQNRKPKESISHIALFEKLELLFAEAVELANSNITNQLLQINLKKEAASSKSTAERRLTLSNAERALSLRARPGIIEVYLMPASQVWLVPESEYASRLKFKLEEIVQESNSSWRLDDADLDDAVLRLIVLASVNDLLREVQTFQHGEVKLAVGEVSLSSAVRDLVSDRNRLSSLLIQQQERIYRQLAMDLHDDVISDLMFVYRDMEGEQVDVADLRIDLYAAMQKLRNLCNELSSREVEDWGLENALEELCQRNSNKSGVNIELSGAESLPPDLPAEVGLQIYRIVQECLNNAIKHSGGSRVQVTIVKAGTELRIETTDDGTKKDSAASNERRAKLGLRIMHERAEIITSLGYSARLDLDYGTRGTGWTTTLYVDIEGRAPSDSLGESKAGGIDG